MPTFTVEDGTGLDDATSYVDLTYANDYLPAGWAAGDTAKQNALMAASEYADARWGSKLKGGLLESDQALEFPRTYLYDRYGTLIEGVPDDWKKAICLYAQASANSELYPEASTTTAKEIKREKTVVGPITKEKEYLGSADAATFLRFPLADRLVRQYLTGVGGGVLRA
jgi:hypothetical protein